MAKQNYLVIELDGSTRWAEIERSRMLGDLYEIVSCDCIETVRTIVPGVSMIIDESGRIKDPPQAHNELASLLYMGWICGNDDICGPAVLVSIGIVDGDFDFIPLDRHQIEVLTSMGLEIPEV